MLLHRVRVTFKMLSVFKERVRALKRVKTR